MKAKKTIALLTSTEGHFSISESIRQVLEPHYHVVVFKRPIFMQTAYVLMYRFFPQLFALPYHLSKKTKMGEQARKFYTQLYGKEILAFLEENQPDFIITTYFMYLDSIQKYAQAHHLDFLNVIANPRGLHPIELCLPEHHNVKFEEWGWFVRDEYESLYTKIEAKKELGLDPTRVTVLLAGGSEGNQKLISLLPLVLKSPRPLNVIVISGSNRALKKVIDAIVATANAADKQVVSLGFTKEMHRYLKAADFIVGKAGPNLLFEAVATQTPFMAISHVSGQEDGNLDIINEYAIGVVAEESAVAEKALNQWLEQPELLTQFKPGLQKLAAHNAQAKPKLLTYVQQRLGE